LVDAVRDVEVMLGAVERSLFFNADVGGEVVVAVEEAFEGADLIFEFVDGVGFFEGFRGSVGFAPFVGVVEF
jgi:hypothetical protein